MPNQETRVEIKPAKGRPMLTWVGKKPLRHAIAYPAQLVEFFKAQSNTEQDEIWQDWPEIFHTVDCSFTATTRMCSLICLPMAFEAR